MMVYALVAHLQNLASIGNAGPPDTTYLYYPHVEGITLQGSLSPACINQNE